LAARSEIIVMNVEDEELLERVRKRNENLTNTIHYIPEDPMLSSFRIFQKPDADELLPREMEG